eukprot:3786722-Lingulodinium_polyedra.AAC.1
MVAVLEASPGMEAQEGHGRPPAGSWAPSTREACPLRGAGEAGSEHLVQRRPALAVWADVTDGGALAHSLCRDEGRDE